MAGREKTILDSHDQLPPGQKLVHKADFDRSHYGPTSQIFDLHRIVRNRLSPVRVNRCIWPPLPFGGGLFLYCLRPGRINGRCDRIHNNARRPTAPHCQVNRREREQARGFFDVFSGTAGTGRAKGIGLLSPVLDDWIVEALL
jgi:hypothetical protein